MTTNLSVFRLKNRLFSALVIIFLLAEQTYGQNAPPQQTVQSIRLRGNIVDVNLQSIILKERSGEVLSITLDEQLTVQEVYPIDISSIERNAFIGTAALEDKNGRLVALEVHVFPESMRGTGEGHRPWDIAPGSSMTNANVEELVSVGNSRELHLKYKGGEKIVFVPESVPVVSYRPANATLLLTGANVILVVTEKDGRPHASRISVGRDGFKPPM